MTRRDLLAFTFLSAAAIATARAADTSKPQPELPREPLTIVTRDGVRHELRVEVARTPDQQEIGLMFRRDIPADGGMLFDWGEMRESDMWMKNTVSSLDMLFIGPDGTVTHIAERATPLSRAIISSGGPVRATLELAAGTAERLGIRVGDKVEFPIFAKAG